jgi:hypothetical protein
MAEPMSIVTRDGTEPNRAGRTGVSEAMRRLLAGGVEFCDVDADVRADDIRAWESRLRALARDLADCVEAPVRNRVMETLMSPSVPDECCALTALRMNVAGLSARGLARETGVAAPTVDRVERGGACQVRVAHALASRFGLAVWELFDDAASDMLTVRTVEDLRTALTTPAAPRGR